MPGAPTASLVTTRNNSWVFGVGNDWDNPIERTPAQGQSLAHQYLPTVGDTYWVQATNTPTTQSGTTVALSDTAPTGDRYNLSVVEVLPQIISPAPTIDGVNPTLGAVGGSVTITGTNFGSTQGTSSVTFNGTAATVCSTCWSATSITALVPSGATTGNVVVTVGGVASNGVLFTVAVPPSITASASPAPNSAGWNNSNVTVTFTCSPGSAPVTNCSSPQTVTSEGSGQIVSGTATDANGLTSTSSVTLNIDKSLPVLSAVSPADGTSVSSSPVTLTGALSDALSGVSAATCNGVNALLSGGNFSCNLSLNSGVNLVAVRATDVAGNIAGANIHLALTGSLPAPQSLMVSPPMVNMLVGDTQQFTALDQLGRPRSDATWTVSDTTLATITTDSSPTLTAVAVGQVTLTASVGAVTAQAQVNILSGTTLPPGTIRWSAPSTSGFSVQQIVQAVPTQNGPDLYSIETDSNNTPLVRALTADGQQLWLAPFPQQAYNYGVFGTPNAAMPDGNGGIIIKLLANPGSFPQQFQVVDLDSQTGSQIWSLSPDLDFIPLSQEAAIRNDGTIFKFGTFQGAPALLGLDPNTGATVFAYSIPTGTATGTTCPNSKVPTVSTLSPPTVGSDGTVYSVLKKTDFVVSGCFPGFSHPEVTLSSLTETLQLLQVAADGGASLTLLRQDINTQTPTGSSFGGQVSIQLVPNQNFNSNALLLDYYQPIPQAQAFHVIPDGQGGTLAPYAFANVQNFVALPAYHQRVAHFSASALQADFPLAFQPTSNPQDFPMVLGENNTAFATDSSTVLSFDVNSGSANWGYSAPSGHNISIRAALDPISGGSVAISDPQAGITSFDSSGNPSQASGGNALSLPSYSWRGSWNAAPTNLGASSVVLPIEPDPVSLWGATLGDPSENGFSAPLDPSSFQTSAAAPQSSICPTCQLQPHSCLTMPGPLPSYLILVGDQGLNNGSGHNHNLGDLLNLAAQQKANDLNQQGGGSWVAVCKVSSIQDFNAALTEVAPGEQVPGQITGGVIYYGHSAYLPEAPLGTLISEHSVLAVGQGTGSDTNISDANVSQLQNVELGPNATIVLNGCNAGAATPAYKRPPIALLIAQQLHRTVFAYDVGVYFSHEDADHDSHFNGLDAVNGQGVARIVSWGLPIYAIPEGFPGHKPRMKTFVSH